MKFRSQQYKLMFIALLIFSASSIPVKGYSQLFIIEAIKTAAKKVIRAIDLQVQRIQNRTIDLQNVQKKIENTLSKIKLEEIATWTQKQKQQYQQYFDELWKVKTILSYYRQFQDLVKKQKQLFEEYKRSYQSVSQDGNFSSDELQYIYSVYTGILETSIANLNDLLSIMQSFTLRMSDGDRLAALNKAADQLDNQITSLRQFTDRNQLLSLQRAKSQQEIDAILQLYQQK